MSASDTLLCLFNAQVQAQDGSVVIEVPERELTLGAIEDGDTYRVAILPSATEPPSGPDGAAEPGRGQDRSEPPVDEGDTLDVEIEDIGEQGDGIARVGPGYVVIVPDTDVGERVTVEITDVRENLAFADVVERHDPMR